MRVGNIDAIGGGNNAGRSAAAVNIASEWLPGGSARSRWLAESGLRDDPALPVQLLVRPGGELACIIQGAIEPGDYDAVKAVLKSPATE